MSKNQETRREGWTGTRTQEATIFLSSSTTPQGRNSGPSSWGLRLEIMPMESPPTHQAMSMLQEALREGSMEIPIKEKLIYSWSNSTWQGINNGPGS